MSSTELRLETSATISFTAPCELNQYYTIRGDCRNNHSPLNLIDKSYYLIQTAMQLNQIVIYNPYSIDCDPTVLSQQDFFG